MSLRQTAMDADHPSVSLEPSLPCTPLPAIRCSAKVICALHAPGPLQPADYDCFVQTKWS